MFYFLRILFHFLLQLEDGIDYLHIYNGGSDHSEMVTNLTGQMNEITVDITTISIPGNQMFVVFHTNEHIIRKGFHALILESKYF